MWSNTGQADLPLGPLLAGEKLILLWYHAHLDILLVLSSNVLLLLLKKLDLLLQSELFHCSC